MTTARPFLFINQHYHPDVAATGQLLTDLCEYLASRGHPVEVLCARGRYQSGTLEAPARESRHGVAIRRYWTPGSGRRRHTGRIADYLAFTIQVGGRLLLGPRPTAVVSLTTPPLLPALAALLARIRGVPFAIWSMDLHPEAEVAAGMLGRDSVLARVLFGLADDAYRQADFVVVLGECMRRLVLSKGLAEARAPVVHAWAGEGEVRPVDRSRDSLAAGLGIRTGDFVIMYSGNAGLAHEFGPFLEAAERLDGDQRTRFLFVGDGPQRSAIESHVRERGLRNFSYQDYFARNRLPESLSLADVHLASLRPEFEGIAVPAKIYGIMASARPVLFLGPTTSESGRTILEFECGAVVDPRTVVDPGESVTRILTTWRDDPLLRSELGSRGRAAFLEHFQRDSCCAVFQREMVRRWTAASRPERPV